MAKERERERKEPQDDEIVDNLAPDEENGEDKPKEKPKKPNKPKKKGKKRGCAMYFFALLALMGIVGGLQASGAVDMRPALYPVVPKLPWVGEQLSNIMGIPKLYALTAQQRRALELEASKKRIDDEIKKTEAEKKRLDALSGDLNLKEADIAKLQKELTDRLKNLPVSDDKKDIKRDLGDLLQTYQDISPRNAAQIMEKMDEELAVTLLAELPQEQTARILAKMTPELAAKLTERLSELKKQ